MTLLQDGGDAIGWNSQRKKKKKTPSNWLKCPSFKMDKVIFDDFKLKTLNLRAVNWLDPANGTKAT